MLQSRLFILQFLGYPSSLFVSASVVILCIFFFPQSYFAQSSLSGKFEVNFSSIENNENNSADQSCDMTSSSRPRRAAKIFSPETFLLKKLAEAQKLLASSCSVDNNTVGISLMECKSGRIYAVTMSKSDFLTPAYQQQYVLENSGVTVTVIVDQPNFVNTKLICESDKSTFIPLTVKYPIIKENTYKETAYYNPAHSALVDFGFYKLGDSYISNIITDAAAGLKKKGLIIPDKVQQLANLLCIVEHIDHGRYRNEVSSKLFREVLTLYALNRGDTYRFSVSRAGAGGMVQMIAPTYREILSTYPQFDWVYDFEGGMKNHNNAAKAMLLYLNRNYDFYLNNSSVKDALDSKYATEEEILAAGYNSNPIRIPSKLEKGENWKYSLPYETQIYLNILTSLNSSVTTGPFEVVYSRANTVSRSKKSYLSSSRIRLITNKNFRKSSIRNIKNRSKSKINRLKSSNRRSPSSTIKSSRTKSVKH